MVSTAKLVIISETIKYFFSKEMAIMGTFCLYIQKRTFRPAWRKNGFLS